MVYSKEINISNILANLVKVAMIFNLKILIYILIFGPQLYFSFRSPGFQQKFWQGFRPKASSSTDQKLQNFLININQKFKKFVRLYSATSLLRICLLLFVSGMNLKENISIFWIEIATPIIHWHLDYMFKTTNKLLF